MKRKNPWAAFEEAARAYTEEYGQPSESSRTKEKNESSIAANAVGSSSDASMEKMAPNRPTWGQQFVFPTHPDLADI